MSDSQPSRYAAHFGGDEEGPAAQQPAEAPSPREAVPAVEPLEDDVAAVEPLEDDVSAVGRHAAHAPRHGTPRQHLSQQASKPEPTSESNSLTYDSDLEQDGYQQPSPTPLVGSTGAIGPKPALNQTHVSSRSAAATKRVAGQRAHHEQQQKKSAPLGGKLPFIVVGVLFVVVVAFVAVMLTSGTSDEEEVEFVSGVEVEVTIADGSGASSIASALYDAGIIDDTSAFLNAVREADAELSLKPGSYILISSTDYDDIIDQLVSGPNNTAYSLTVPEGYTVEKIAALVEERFGISADTFIAQAVASNYVEDYSFLGGVQNDSLEGYLFPKTYDFSSVDEITADVIIRAMLDQFETETASLDLASAAASISSEYGIEVDENDIVIMASIIEKEAVTDDQRGLISSVFYNRLSAGMYLQSDATMGYVTGGAVTSDDLKTESEYNTYLNYGLTPTAICSPSLESLEAACSPEDTNYYYFYITDSVEAFSQTYDEHLNAINSDS